MDTADLAWIPARWLGYSEIEVSDAAHVLNGLEPPASRAASRRLRGGHVRAIAAEIGRQTGAVTLATHPDARSAITQEEFRALARQFAPVSSPDMHQEDLKALAGGCYSIQRAAHLIAVQLGYSEDDERKLCDSMARAAYLGKLYTRGQDGHDMYARTAEKPGTDHDYFRWVSPADVNEWAKASGFRWFWLVDGAAPTIEDVEPSAALVPQDLEEPEKPINAEAIRRLFGGAWKGKADGLKNDMSHATRNGLSAARAVKGHGWYASKLKRWGVENGRIDPAPSSTAPTPIASVFDMAGKRHLIQG